MTMNTARKKLVSPDTLNGKWAVLMTSLGFCKYISNVLDSDICLNMCDSDIRQLWAQTIISSFLALREKCLPFMLNME